MAQHHNGFKKYVSRIDEVGSTEGRPGWLADKLGATKRREAETEQMFRFGNAIAKYLHFNINDDEIRRGLAGEYRTLRSSGQQAFIQLVRSIYASKNNKPPVGLTKGQIEAMMRFLTPAVLARHVGTTSSNSPEAFAIFLGQMAQSMGGHINLEPGFQKEVQEYYSHNQKTLKQRGNEQLRDTKKAGEIRRGGLGYVASQIKQMGIADETVTDIRTGITQAMRNAAAAGRDTDAEALRQFLLGLT